MARRKKNMHSTTIEGKQLRPESLMMTYGYKPEWSEGAIKSPIFQTSTFAFKSAEEGKAFFELAYGLREAEPNEKIGMIYSRLNNPDLEILEDRLTLWDKSDGAAVFASGMAAIATTFFTFLKPGSIIIHSEPVYGGTDYLLKHILPEFGIKSYGFPAGKTGIAALEKLFKKESVAANTAMVFIETPANPTNSLVDIEAVADVIALHKTKKRQILLAVDNTYLGPLWQHPLKHRADLVLYSATKYIGGHSDVIAGVCLGSNPLMTQVKIYRTIMGTMADPWTGWLLLRSMETLKLRMTAEMEAARYVADFLAKHPKVERVYYLGHLTKDDSQYDVYKRQCLAPGGMIAFDIVGGEAEAFRFLNNLSLFRLAVSLGGTESLAEHPASMTHSDVDPKERQKMNITDKMIRLSIGVEHHEDLIADLKHAFSAV